MRFVIYLLIALVVGYAVAAGLGLTHAKKRGERKAEVLDDFEDADHDMDWGSEGYAKVEYAKENQTHGKHSAKVTLFAPGQFRMLPSPTATPAPAIPIPVVAAKTKGKTVAPAQAAAPVVDTPTPVPTPNWQPKILLDTRTVTKLKVFDWQEFGSLKLDAFNAQDKPMTYHVEITDSKTYKYETSGPMVPKKVTNIAIPTDELAKARMDLSNIASIRFWVEPVPAAQPAVVYVDYLRLEGSPETAKKK